MWWNRVLFTMTYLITSMSPSHGTVTVHQYTALTDPSTTTLYTLWTVPMGPTRTTLTCAVECSTNHNCVAFVVRGQWGICEAFTNTSGTPKYVYAFGDTIFVTTKLACDAGWTAFKDLCYWFEGYIEPISWKAARDKCIGLGAQLASVKTPEVRSFLESTTPQPNTSMWLGGNDINKEGVWTWLDGSVVDKYFNEELNWNLGEPNNYGDGEDCMIMEAGKWNDGTCDTSENKQYVCEKPTYLTP